MAIFLFEFSELYCYTDKLTTEDTIFTHLLFIETCFMFSTQYLSHEYVHNNIEMIL